MTLFVRISSALCRFAPSPAPLVAAMAILLASGSAAVAGPCVSAPLTSYLVGGFNCDVDGAVFTNFSFLLQNASGPTTPLTDAEITVSPLSSAGQVGLRFSGNFLAEGAADGPGPTAGSTNITYRFMYQVARPDSIFTAVGSALNAPSRFAPNPLKLGDIFASNLASNDAAQSVANDDDPDLSDTAILNTPRLTVTADDLLVLSAGASAAGTATPVGLVSVRSADYLFAYDVVVPEPSTWILCGTGLALFTLRRLRSSSIN